MRCAIAAVSLTCALLCPAFADFYTVAEWERLAPFGRSAYVSGAIDGMQQMTVPADKLGFGLREAEMACMQRTKVTNMQIADGLIELIKRKPALRSGSMAVAVTEYVSELCPDLLQGSGFGRILDKALKD